MPTKPQHAHRYRAVTTLIRALREEAGLTQRDLGKRLNLPQSWVYKCETGIRRMDIAEFCDWCKACEIEPVIGLRRFLRYD
ncbi:MAG: helix-turn-helix transcriptional regulator [Planctomycetes bacterium]|nr:helix-turn-helix transcriptional regulator [Planctomycetota bacterium]